MTSAANASHSYCTALHFMIMAIRPCTARRRSSPAMALTALHPRTLEILIITVAVRRWSVARVNKLLNPVPHTHQQHTRTYHLKSDNSRASGFGAALEQQCRRKEARGQCTCVSCYPSHLFPWAKTAWRSHVYHVGRHSAGLSSICIASI
jgi:hypothetical protein